MNSSLQGDVAGFLRTRRQRVQPTPDELRSDPRPRRVAGLRREEVAHRAAISVDYYIQLERGQVRGVSDGVLAAVMDALELSGVERRYFMNLLAAGSARVIVAPEARHVSAGLQSMVEAMGGVAVTLRNHRMEMVGANPRGRGLFRWVRYMSDHNIARHVFLDPRSRRLYPGHDEVAAHAVGTLRVALAEHRDDDLLADLVEELRVDQRFDELWQEHVVLRTGPGQQVFDDPDVGRLVLQREQFAVLDGSGLVMNVYRGQDASSQQRLDRLAVLADQ